MPDIRHRVGIAAPQHRVYEMLATNDGLARFWAQVEGDSEVGGKLSFFFGKPQPSAVMEVVELSPDDYVQWRCVEGPPEWVGTTVTFDLKDSGGETVLLFTHADWRSGSSSCTTAAPESKRRVGSSSRKPWAGERS